MSDILFIRHAETDMAGTFCGQSNPELNANGLLQLAGLLDRLRTEDVGVVYTSDLRRAYATGIAIAETFGVFCHVRPALREIDFGRWEGLTWDEIEHQDETYARQWIAEYPWLPAPAGESFQDFEQRVLKEVGFLLAEAEIASRVITVIAHAGVIRTALRALSQCSEENARAQTNSYCSIVRWSAEIESSCGRSRKLTKYQEEI